MKNLIAFNIILLLSSIQVFAQNHPTDWVLNYAFDGNANDDGPYKNNGIIKGNVKPTKDRFGKDDKALFFDGQHAGYISIPFNETLNLPTQGFTFSVWINLLDYHKTGYWDLVKTDKYAPIFCKSETEQFFQYRLCLTSKGYHFDGVNNNYLYGSYDTEGPVIRLKTWQHLVVTYDNARLNLYVNGVLQHSTTFSNNFVTDKNPLVIGKDLPGAIEYFNGYMDDFKVWNRSLNTKEVSLLYTYFSVEEKKDSTPVVVNKDSKETFDIVEGQSIVLHQVLFVQSKTDLVESSFPELEKLLETLRQNPNVVIEIAGHTDNQGEREKNIELSENRAKKIKSYLTENGIADKRIRCVGYGPDKPLNKNRNESERKLNRRVEFRILSQ